MKRVAVILPSDKFQHRQILLKNYLHRNLQNQFLCFRL